MFFSKFILFSLGLLLADVNAQHSEPDRCHRCKVLPGDAAWPSKPEWDALNKTVDGRLVATVPVGTPCHAANFDADACAVVQAGWDNAAFHDKSSSSMMSAYYANKSCDPFSGPDSPCVIGTYVQYAVDVSTPAHIISTVRFATKKNIRFVVRNTGHDYMGKSTGRGALSVWTHHLKSAEFIDYKSETYNGPAMKAGAGMQVHETYQAADVAGYAVAGGDCPTVGLVGGWTQGGGHGPMGGAHGLGADQTLSFEVITAEGVFTTASPTQNADLYWALSGGGGGSYAIVWSVTVKAFPQVPITTAAISFTTSDTVSLDQWWAAMDVYQASIPSFTAAKSYSLSAITKGFFALGPSFFPNATKTEVAALFQPLIDHLTNASIPFNSSINTYSTLLEAYDTENVPALSEVGNILVGGGRLMPKSLWETEESFKKMTGVVRDIIDDGATIIDAVISPSLDIAGHPNNAVLPAWRDSNRLVDIIVKPVGQNNATAQQIADARTRLTTVYGAALRELTPNSGSYLNEADVLDPDWKNSFYGPNYSKLLQIKNKWDPNGLLYGSTSVGGDLWELNKNGALCRVNTNSSGAAAHNYFVNENGKENGSITSALTRLKRYIQ